MGHLTSKTYEKIVHDLKSPLSALKVEVSLLIKYAGKMPSSKILKSLKKIDSKINALSSNLNYFLELEKLSKNKAEFLYEFLEPDKIIKEVSEALSKRFKKTLSSEGETQKKIISDRKFLTLALYLTLKSIPSEKIVLNLKQTGKEVRIKISGKEIEKDNIEYYLADLIFQKLGGELQIKKGIEVKLPFKPRKPNP